MGRVFTIIAIGTKVVNVPFFVLYPLLLNTLTRTLILGVEEFRRGYAILTEGFT